MQQVLCEKGEILYKVNVLGDEQIENAETIAFGDAHANPIQVIYQMLHARIGYMPPEKLAILAFIYEIIDKITKRMIKSDEGLKLIERDAGSKSYIKKACELIARHFEYVGNSKTFVHLGDLLFDRGVSDEIMLALLNKIKQQAGDKLIVLASNHGPLLEDIEWDVWQARSGAVAHRTADQGPTSFYEKLYEFFSKNAQLFYYNSQTNTFFTHCPISREDLENFVHNANQIIQSGELQEQLTNLGIQLTEIKIPPADATKEEILEFVDQANNYYRAAISWFLQDREYGKIIEKRSHPIAVSLTTVLGTSVRGSYKNKTKSFNTKIVHGHDGDGGYDSENQVYNLNGEAGKILNPSIHKDLFIYSSM